MMGNCGHCGSCSWYEYLYQAVSRHPSPLSWRVFPARQQPSAAPQSMEMSAARKEIFRMTNGLSAAPATWPAPAAARGAVAVSTLWSRTTGYGHLPPSLATLPPLPRHGLHIHLSRQPAARAPLERICGHSVLGTGDYTGTATLAPL